MEKISFNKKYKKTKGTERGELMRYFTDTLNKDLGSYKPVTIPRMGYILQGLNLEALYYLKSIMEEAEREGRSPQKLFWWKLKSK